MGSYVKCFAETKVPGIKFTELYGILPGLPVAEVTRHHHHYLAFLWCYPKSGHDASKTQAHRSLKGIHDSTFFL